MHQHCRSLLKTVTLYLCPFPRHLSLVHTIRHFPSYWTLHTVLALLLFSVAS